MANIVEIVVRGKDETSRVFDDAERRGGRFGGAMGRIGTIAGGVLSAGFIAGAGRAIVGFFGDMITEAEEAQKVSASTAQGIKTMGAESWTSAEAIGNLSQKISEQIGVDDELIQTSANLLLTFGNIKNAVGEGANIFDRATWAAQDLAAKGFGSADSAAKMLGKALNDPIKGMTALGKAGVTFTAEQKEQIKTMAEAGDILGAQKIIMGEVERQVGGTAAATATGTDKMKVAWANFKEEIGTALLPVWNELMGSLAGSMKELGPEMAAAVKDIAPMLGTMLSAFVDIIQASLPYIKLLAVVITALGPALGPIIGVLAVATVGFKAFATATAIMDVLPAKFAAVAARAVVSFAAMTVAATAHAAVSIASAVASAAAWIAANAAMILASGGIILAIGAIIAIIVLLVQNWDWVKEKASQLWEWMKIVWEGIKIATVDVVQGILSWLGENWPMILAIMGGPLGRLLGLVIGNWDRIQAVFWGAINIIKDFLYGLGQGMLDIMSRALAGLVGLVIGGLNNVTGFFRALPGRLLGAVGNIGGMFLGVGRSIIDGIWIGLRAGWGWLVGQVGNLARSLLNAAKRALGIGSPSKEFEKEFGAEIPPGAARGITRNAGVAQRAAQVMADRILETARGKLATLDYGGGSPDPQQFLRDYIARQPKAGQQSQSSMVIRIESGGSRMDELIMEVLRKSIRVQGGDVQVVLGS